MTPALEYLIRSGLIKQWFEPPCSLFLAKGNGDKFVITIADEFKPSQQYSVKHWDLTGCNDQQAIPAMVEYSVPKEEIFCHRATIMPECHLLSYQQETIRYGQNSYRSPMSAELYKHFYDNCLNSIRHRYRRLNWLWARFVSVYMPDLGATNRLFSYSTDSEIAEDQRAIVARLMKRKWQYWQKWQQYLLLTPGELFFSREYT